MRIAESVEAKTEVSSSSFLASNRLLMRVSLKKNGLMTL